VTHNPVRSLLQRSPLRVTLVVALVLLAAIGLTVSGAVVTSSIRGYLVGQVDKDLAQLVQRNPPVGRPGDADDGPDAPFRTSRDEYYAITDRKGVAVSGLVGTINGKGTPKLSPADIVNEAGQGPFDAPGDGHGHPWRVQVRSTFLSTPNAAPLPILYVRAVSLGDVEDTTHRLVVLELVVGVLVLALLGGLAYGVVRTSLRPLQEVEVAAAEIADGDLTRRVPESQPSTEVGRLSRAFNSMVSQIETAFRAREASEASALASEERMRRFVADASHELRTPLTSIRGFAELYRQGAVPDAESLDRVMRRVEDEAARMGLLVEDLLVLARLDQQRPLDLEPVDLLEVAGDVVHDARVLAPDRAIDLALHGEGAPVVLGDEGPLRQVVTNLVSNALTHTPAGTPVSVSLEVLPATDAGPDRVLLAVADQGPGMTEEARAKVFERFYRADPSRTRAAGGSGLGLSIVAALVAAHGGRVGVQSEPGVGSRFLVDLPQHRLSEPAGPDVTRSDLTQVAEDSQAGHRFSGDDDEASSPSRTL
jgi:two-component system, OmpR family, sensor kinase